MLLTLEAVPIYILFNSVGGFFLSIPIPALFFVCLFVLVDFLMMVILTGVR